ncbi:MAG: hypothetical protein K2P68_11660, partial [Sphingomonas sp.]|nr:hypothetical protein [Sphingomonas sp.]
MKRASTAIMALAIGLSGSAVAQTTSPPPTSPPASPPKTTYILAGHVLDKPGEPMRGATTIIVTDGAISAVKDGFQSPADGSPVIDLKDSYVLPGLIDMHVHLWGIGGDPLRARLLD